MKKKGKKKRGFPWVLPVIAAMAAFVWWDNNALATERVEFGSPRLPAGFDGFTIVQLSDLHGKEFGKGNETLLAAVAAEQPDLIAVTGDLVDQYKSAPQGYVTELGQALCALAPTYYITGNHEWALGGVPELKKELAAAGVTVLSNQYVLLERGGDSAVLAGIDDPNGYADQKTPEALTAELYADQGHPFWILLAHRNGRFAQQYSLLGADLTLTGHAHGGLVRLPLAGGMFGHDGRLFPGYDAGFYTENGATMFASRGLGNSGPSFRLFNRPEVVSVTLRRED